jgi:hypothetical protein
MVADRTFDVLKTLASVDGNKIRSIISSSHVGEELVDTILELLLLVSLFTPASSTCSVLGGNIKEQAHIRARKTFFRMATPGKIEVGVILGRRIDASRIVVPVNDDGGSSFDVCFD